VIMNNFHLSVLVTTLFLVLGAFASGSLFFLELTGIKQALTYLFSLGYLPLSILMLIQTFEEYKELGN